MQLLQKNRKCDDRLTPAVSRFSGKKLISLSLQIVLCHVKKEKGNV